MSENQDRTQAEGLAPTPDVIESASATTSSERNHAGATPYVIVVAVLAVLLVGCSGVSSILSLAAETYRSGGVTSGLGGLGDDDADDLGGLLGDQGDGYDDGYGYDYDDPYDSQDSRHGASTQLTPDNVFDQDLSCLDESLSAYVFASDYDGAQPVVTATVRALVKADDTATKQVVSHVRAAAATSDDATRADELTQAAQLCVAARQQVSDVALPDGVTGSRADEVADELSDAKESLLERWDAVGKVVDILASPDGHTSRELSKLDDEASDLLDLGMDLSDALAASAASK